MATAVWLLETCIALLSQGVSASIHLVIYSSDKHSMWKIFRWQVLSSMIDAPALPQKMLVFFFWKSMETWIANLTNEIDLRILTTIKLWNQTIDIELPLWSFVYLFVRSMHNVCTCFLYYIRNSNLWLVHIDTYETFLLFFITARRWSGLK